MYVQASMDTIDRCCARSGIECSSSPLSFSRPLSLGRMLVFSPRVFVDRKETKPRSKWSVGGLRSPPGLLSRCACVRGCSGSRDEENERIFGALRRVSDAIALVFCAAACHGSPLSAFQFWPLSCKTSLKKSELIKANTNKTGCFGSS